MRYGEAFAKLGYQLVRPRQDWTAIKSDGVCVSLWKREIDWKSAPLRMASRVRGGPLEEWVNRFGDKLRREHLALASERYGGWVDAVIVDGIPGEGVDSAEPWTPKVRHGLRWRIIDFDPVTGHFTAEAHKPG